MADKTYLYRDGAVTADKLVPLLAPAVVFSIGAPDSPTMVSVTLDEANKGDLDAGMLQLGFEFVAEQAPAGPIVGETAQPAEAVVAVGDFVFWDTADARFERASAAAVGTTPALSIVATKPTGTTVTLRAIGQIDGITDDLGAPLVPGSIYYLSPTVAGKVTATPPTTTGQVVQRLGVALSATVLQFTVDLDTVEL